MSLIANMLMKDEGCRLKVYTDTLGHPSIGYGRALDTNGISIDEADYLLANDIARVTQEVSGALPWFGTLDGSRQAVLLSMAFQMGIEGLLAFRQTLAYIQTQRWQEASDAMLNSKWASQTPERAQRLANIILTGDSSAYN